MFESGTAKGNSAGRKVCSGVDRAEISHTLQETSDEHDLLEDLRSHFGLRRCTGSLSVPVYRSRELTDATAHDVASMQTLGITKIFDL
ncbi:MAG: hypothetical protein RR619_01900, partial [Raoultibacter sp.]